MRSEAAGPAPGHLYVLQVKVKGAMWWNRAATSFETTR